MGAVSQPITVKESESGSRAWRFLKKELAPTPGRLSASIRIAIAAVIVTTLGEVGRSKGLFIALFVLVSLPRDFPKQTWKAALQILATVWCSVLIGLALDVLVADLRALRVLALGFSVFFCLIVGRGLRLPLVGILSAVVLAAGLTQWDASSNVGADVDFLLWYGLMISTGVLTATCVEYLYPHPSPLQRVVRGIAERLDAMQAVLKKTSGAPLNDQERERVKGIHSLAVTGTGSLQAFLPAISSNQMLDEDYLIRLSSLVMAVEVMAELAARLNDFSPDDFDERERRRLAELSAESGQLADCIRRQDTSQGGNKPEAETTASPDEPSPAILLAHIEFVLERVWNTWYSESYFVGEVAKRDIYPPKNKASSPGPFFTEDNVHFAFKTAMASMICYLIYNGVAWPGISTSLVTCFIVALDTVGATFRKLFLRLAGVAIGGLFFGIGGIALVLSNMTNLVELLLAVAIIFFISGWVVKGSQRISYAGVQIGLSFALVALNRPTIPDQIVEARDRFMGVLLGAVVMWFTFRQFWPVNAIAQQRSQIAGLVRQAGEMGALAEGDQPVEERVDRVRDIRSSANQAIFLANEQADAAGFDSHYDPRLQNSLRTCLQRSEALLLLELIDAGFAVTHPLPPLPEKVRSAREQFAVEYPKYLSSVAQQIESTDGQRQAEQLQAQGKTFRELSEVLSGRLREMQESGDTDTKRYAEIRSRILQRRQEFTQQLAEAAEALARNNRSR